jgi:HPt (histidine-containing phosphotransfer) domain-containing protein
MIGKIELYSTLSADPDLAELVALFVAEMPERIEQLLAAYRRGELEQLRRTAHQLKGAVGSYGFDQLTPSAARLEAAARGGASPEEIEACLAELTNLCRLVRAGTGHQGQPGVRNGG